MKQNQAIKVIITKIGLDAHDRGAIVVANLLKEAGMEVVYLGRFQTPESIVKSALEEDAEVIGLSCMSPNHVLLVPDLIDLLKKEELDDILVIAGGIIPEPYASQLKDAGVKEIFGAATPSGQIVNFIQSNVQRRQI